MVKPTRERVREWREKKAKKGGRSLSVWLEPDTARMLHELLSHYGETASPLIARAISTLYDSTSIAPLQAEPAPARQSQPSVHEAKAATEPPAMEPEAPSVAAEPIPGVQETPLPVADSPPPLQEQPSPMLEPSATAVGPAAAPPEAEAKAVPEHTQEVLELADEPPAEPLAAQSELEAPSEAEDPLLKEIQDQLARGVPFRKLHRSLLLDWLKTMQAQGVSFQVMADKLNAAGIPTLAGSGRWEQGMIPTVLLLSAGSPGH